MSSTTVRTSAARTGFRFREPALVDEVFADQPSPRTAKFVVMTMDKIVNVLEGNAQLSADGPSRWHGGCREKSDALCGSGNALPGGSPGCGQSFHF
jgi:hypothetical protein